MEKLRLSPRGYTRAMRVGRTIADLAGVEVVQRLISPRRWRSAIACQGENGEVKILA